MELEDRFWENVQRGTEQACWSWLAGCNGHGYGAFYLRPGELGVSRSTQVGAHRMAFYLVHGRWPDPQGLHGCDNRKCCNPLLPELELHVHEGTQAKNIREAVQRGRHRSPVYASGEHPHIRTSPAVAAEIRKLHAAGGVSQDWLAGQFGIGQSTVSRIIQRKVSY